MVTYDELLANKQAAISAKLAASGESVESYIARTGIDPTVAMTEGAITAMAPFEYAGETYTLPTAPAAVAAMGVQQSSMGGLLAGGATGALTTLLASLGLPASLVAVIGGAVGAGATVYGALQALGLGEGEGLFGLDILGGDVQYVDGIPIGGPGLAEPGAEILQKEWHVNYDWGTLQYYLVVKPGTKRKYIMLYNTATKKWKAWPWHAPSLAVIGKNMPSHRMLTRLRRNLSKHSADARSLLKITSPKSLKEHRYRRRR